MKQTKPKTWIIRDWIGNVCFGGVTFPSFEDAWGYVYENDPAPSDEEADKGWYDDYYVVEVDADD